MMGWFTKVQKAPQASRSDIGFPNASRSYDAARRGVRFWGNDSAMDADFVVSEAALHRLQSGLKGDEADFLRAFDAHRQRILEAAVKIYKRESRGIHVVGVGDI